MAVHTNDVVLLPITFAAWKFCENFTYEDNFNNTFTKKVLFLADCSTVLRKGNGKGSKRC